MRCTLASVASASHRNSLGETVLYVGHYTGWDVAHTASSLVIPLGACYFIRVCLRYLWPAPTVHIRTHPCILSADSLHSTTWKKKYLSTLNIASKQGWGRYANAILYHRTHTVKAHQVKRVDHWHKNMVVYICVWLVRFYTWSVRACCSTLGYWSWPILNKERHYVCLCVCVCVCVCVCMCVCVCTCV